MTTYRKYLLLPVVLMLLAPLAHAQKEVKIRRINTDHSPHPGNRGDEPMEKESVAFLGIETAPVTRTLSAQLGLAKDTGLVVIRVTENSPAAAVLKQDDVLIKLEDQLLINPQQLGVLVRSRKEGDEIKLTVVRAGKEITVKAKLAMHEVPKLADVFFYQNSGGLPAFERVRELPGMGPDDARKVLRMIERERGNFTSGPGVHIVGRAGRGSTIVDLPRSNIMFSDDDGAIEIKVDDGKRNLTVKNPKGDVAFNGPINTEEERKKLPPDILRRLEKIESDSVSFEVNGDFEPETIPLAPEAGRTKINREFRTDIGEFHPTDERSQPSF